MFKSKIRGDFEHMGPILLGAPGDYFLSRKYGFSCPQN